MRMNQKGEEGTTNYQAQNITVTNGVTYSQAREIAIDVFKANFLDMQEEAKEVAITRAEEITSKFISKLVEEHPEGLSRFNTPDLQYSLFDMQKQYAKCGDDNISDLLVELLVERTKENERTIKQIVLGESLKVLSSLTDEQINILSLVFVLRYTVQKNCTNIETLSDYLNEYIKPISENVRKSQISYRHLEYMSCGKIETGEIKIEEIFRRTYGGLFSKGFEISEIEKYSITMEKHGKYFTTCLRDKNKHQINALSIEVLEELFLKDDLSEQEINGLKSLYNSPIMNHQEIKEDLIERNSFMEHVIDLWNDSYMKKFGLTSVGIAIGHANMKKALGKFANLDIWLS